MSIRFLKLLLLLITLGFGAASCEAPTDFPVQSGSASYGLLANSNVGSYFYPTTPGYLYVYTNTLRVEQSDGTITNYTGLNDSLKTLGLMGTTAQGEPVYGVSVKYRVLGSMAGHTIQPLRYLPSNPNFGGAYVDGAAILPGELITGSLFTRAVSNDSLTAPCYGRIRSLASDLLGGSSTSVWQTDTVFFTQSINHVAIWTKTAAGSFVKAKDLFRPDVPVVTGSQWSYSTWQPNTKIKVLIDNAPITVGMGTFNALHTEITNQDLTMEYGEQKFFASGKGLIKQVDTWWTTTNGTSRTKNTIIKEGIVVIDLDETW